MGLTKCNTPKCVMQAKWKPVAKLPTVRENSEGRMVETDKPTLIILPEVCEGCKESYNFEDWFDARDWRDMQHEAQQRGFNLPERRLIEIVFRPLGWDPNQRWLPMERS